MKMCWHQDPKNGRCPIPPGLAYRLDNSNKFSWHGTMVDFELLLKDVDKLCSTVAGTKETETVRKQPVLWVAVTEINLCALATSCAKLEDEGANRPSRLSLCWDA